METIAKVIGRSMEYWTPIGAYQGMFLPLLLISPCIARVIAEGGRTKDDIRQYMYDNVKAQAGWLERLAWQTGPTTFSSCRSVEQGLMSKEFCHSTDPNRMVPVFLTPDSIGIVVSGDPERNQSKGYVQNQRQRPPVSKQIMVPANWERLFQ